MLGAGYAGIEAALTLHKRKRRTDDIEITIIDRNSYHTLLTELHEVAGNRIGEEGVIVPLREIFKYTDVKIVKDEIMGIDFENSRLTANDAIYQYDYLIIAAGSEPNYYGIEGLKEYGLPLWSFRDAVRIREHIKDCFTRASQEKDGKLRKALLTFVIGGGGFTGVETAGELAHWVRDLGREYGIPRNEVKLMLVEALPGILVNLDEASAMKAERYLSGRLKVEVLKNNSITRVEKNSVELENGTVIPTSTLIWSAGVKASDLSDRVEIEKSKASRIIVDEYAKTQYKNVYAAGDIAAFTAGGNELPALVESALQTGKGAAVNILADIRGNEKIKLKPELHGVMVSVGSYFAVANIMGRRLPMVISILMKYLVNIHYLFGIGGFELACKYLRHEFLGKRQRKTVVEKHISVTTPTLWLVPIRLFLGYSWLMEGIRKVKEGWLTRALLTGTPPDTASSATITESGEKVFSIVSEHTPYWYAWIADNIVVPNALLFQILIVLSEIGIGLALISGTFTFIAALAAIGLNINFILSTGLYDYNRWYIPAALCLLGGAGRAFGLDYYIIPYLMRQWRYFIRNRRIRPWLFD